MKKPKRKKVAEEPPKVVPYPVKSTDQKTGLVCKMKEDETAGIWVFKNGSRTSYQCMVCLAVRRSVHKCNFRTLPYVTQLRCQNIGVLVLREHLGFASSLISKQVTSAPLKRSLLNGEEKTFALGENIDFQINSTYFHFKIKAMVENCHTYLVVVTRYTPSGVPKSTDTIST